MTLSAREMYDFEVMYIAKHPSGSVFMGVA